MCGHHRTRVPQPVCAFQACCWSCQVLSWVRCCRTRPRSPQLWRKHSEPYSWHRSPGKYLIWTIYRLRVHRSPNFCINRGMKKVQKDIFNVTGTIIPVNSVRKSPGSAAYEGNLCYLYQSGSKQHLLILKIVTALNMIVENLFKFLYSHVAAPLCSKVSCKDEDDASVSSDSLGEQLFELVDVYNTGHSQKITGIQSVPGLIRHLILRSRIPI